MARGLRRISSFGRLIAMDLRGWGAPSEVRLDSLPAMQAWTDDIGCAMEAVGSSEAVIFGTAETCLPAMLFAATHPDRTQAHSSFTPPSPASSRMER
jgi:pimeloyl-ACP methyl ester carboxylesterase